MGSLSIFFSLYLQICIRRLFLKKITHKLSKWLHPSPLAQITLLIWLHLITNKQTNKTPLDSSGSLRIFYKVHDTWPLTSRNSQSDEAVAIINNSSRTNYSVIQTVEKLMWHLSLQPEGWAKGRVGPERGTQPSEFIPKLEISKDWLVHGEPYIYGWCLSSEI